MKKRPEDLDEFDVQFYKMFGKYPEQKNSYDDDEPPRKKSSKKKKKKKRSVGRIILIIILVLIIIIVLPWAWGTFKRTKLVKDAQERGQMYSADDYKAMCKELVYDEIARDENALQGEFFTFTGEVYNDLGDDLYSVYLEGSLKSVVIYCPAKSKLLSGDKVTVWGESVGTITGKNLFGGKVKAPKIVVIYIEIDDSK